MDLQQVHEHRFLQRDLGPAGGIAALSRRDRFNENRSPLNKECFTFLIIQEKIARENFPDVNNQKLKF